jgi:hypothetical protein
LGRIVPWKEINSRIRNSLLEKKLFIYFFNTSKSIVLQKNTFFFYKMDFNGNIEQELTSMKHKIITAADNIIFDEILMLQRTLATPNLHLQEFRAMLETAENITTEKYKEILEKAWAAKNEIYSIICKTFQ